MTDTPLHTASTSPKTAKTPTTAPTLRWLEHPPTQEPTQDELHDALRKGIHFFASTQQEDGSWCGDYGGPMFLLPMYVAAAYICKRPMGEAQREGMIRYILSTQNQDGGIGIHAEAKESMMFTSVLCYVALRLLDLPPEDPALQKLQAWIQKNGGALAAASWAKWILCVLNLYDYDGLHPIPPELYLLPKAFPLHPGRLWCHARQVYLPMSYLYGTRAHIPLDDRLRSIRQALYTENYESIEFAAHRDTLCAADRSYDLSPLARLANLALQKAEAYTPAALRRRALNEVKRHIDFEDETTHHIRIGPVNAVLNTLVQFFADPHSEHHQKSWQTLPLYLWEGHDGIKMNGYNSCKLWDTAFGVQALLAAPLQRDAITQRALDQAFFYIRENQVLEDVPEKERYFRHASRGGWPFSDRLHGWPITDCTAEGFKSAVALEEDGATPIPPDLLQESINLLLSFQNEDGGWASYERQRAGAWLEIFNPSQAFRDIMVDYSYTECSSACLQALHTAQQRFPHHRPQEVAQAIARGEAFLRQKQRADGSWEGSWAVCFTYGTWFGVWGLRAAGVPAEDPAIQAACRFLQIHQRPDGAWGEHYQSCLKRRYIHHADGQAAQTAWALLALCKGGLARSEAAHRAARFLLQQQQSDGDWPREAMVGVFNKTTLINYENYRRIFPLWALSLYAAEQQKPQRHE